MSLSLVPAIALQSIALCSLLDSSVSRFTASPIISILRTNALFKVSSVMNLCFESPLEARVIYSVSSRIWLKYSLKDILGIPNNRRLQVWAQAFGRDQFDFAVEQFIKVKTMAHEISEVLLAFSEFNKKINITRLFLFFPCKRTK